MTKHAEDAHAYEHALAERDRCKYMVTRMVPLLRTDHLIGLYADMTAACSTTRQGRKLAAEIHREILARAGEMLYISEFFNPDINYGTVDEAEEVKADLAYYALTHDVGAHILALLGEVFGRDPAAGTTTIAKAHEAWVEWLRDEEYIRADEYHRYVIAGANAC